MPHDIDAERELLREATGRLIRTVDSLPDDAFAEPSGLPGWTRGHVVAHLALNSEGLAGALAGLVQGEPTPIYASQEDRDGDIDELAQANPTELRDRMLAGSSLFDDASVAIPDGGWGSEIERTPGGPSFSAAATVLMRLREVEIHHVDLNAGYRSADWPPAFARLLLDSMTRRHTGDCGFRVVPTDLDGTWSFGEPGPTVTGSAHALGWWLTGRGDGEGLASDDGRLPEISSW